MPPHQGPLIIPQRNVRLRAAHLYLLANLRPLTIRHHLLAQAQKDHIKVREATAEAMVVERPSRSFIHQALGRTVFHCSHDPAHSNKRHLRRLPVYILHNNPLLRSCSFRQSDRHLREHTRIQPWHNNNKGRLNSSKSEKVEEQDALATMAPPDSQTLNDRG